jgi:hypothetical protein
MYPISKSFVIPVTDMFHFDEIWYEQWAPQDFLQGERAARMFAYKLTFTLFKMFLLTAIQYSEKKN